MPNDDLEVMLRRCLALADENEEAEARFNVGAFRDILGRIESGRLRNLSASQRLWICDVHEKLFDEPTYQNLFSAGKVPRGLREVPTPAVLQNRPLKPPGRR
jgi:hypothetical protein